MTTTLEALDRLIAFPTVSADSNLGLIDYAEDHLKSCGFSTRRLMDKDQAKAGLFAEIGPRGRGVVLSAHSDVVPVVGQNWTRAPFKMSREGDRAYGRGATDMKGFLAAMLSLAARASSVTLAEPLKLCISYDEEVGCTGVQKMMDRLPTLLGEPRYCIVGEPTAMQVAIGHKGKAALRAVCSGQSGHSALAPKFVNALDLAADFVVALRALQSDVRNNGARDTAYDVPYTTLHVGRLAGGKALNMIPAEAEIDFEYRHLAEDDPATIEERITRAAEEVSARYSDHFEGAAIAVSKINSYPGLSNSSEADVVDTVRALTGIPRTTKVAFGTEAGFFDALGIPTVVCGPGDMETQGHQPDEHITTAQLAACDAMLDRLLLQLAA